MITRSLKARMVFALALIPAILSADPALSAETMTLDDGTTCTVTETIGDQGGRTTSSSVTAGGGNVSSSTTVNGQTTTQSGRGSAAASAGSSTSSHSSGATSTSMASVTLPDGTTVTRRSDGTCHITKPDK